MKKTNVSRFEDGQTLYLYFYGFIRDRSGRCSLGMANSLEDALERSTHDKIYKVKLEEVQLKNTTEKIQIEKSKWDVA